MRRSVTSSFLLLAALAASGDAMADDDRLRRYELPNFDALELGLPPGWLDSVEQPPGSDVLTIELRPPAGAAFEAYLTPEWTERPPGRVQDAETLRESVRDAAARLPAPAGAEPPDIRRLQGRDGVGFYFVADEAAPEDGPRHLVQGALLVGELVLRFEILTHDADDPSVALALAMLQDAQHLDRGHDQP